MGKFLVQSESRLLTVVTHIRSGCYGVIINREAGLDKTALLHTYSSAFWDRHPSTDYVIN